METAYFYLGVSGVFAILLWTPYILSRAITWGIPTFLNNYPDGFPQEQPDVPLWAARAHRAHLNMLETLLPFTAVVVAADQMAPESSYVAIAMWAQIFFLARLGHAVVYILGVPYLRTPVYLVSWLAVLMIGSTII